MLQESFAATLSTFFFGRFNVLASKSHLQDEQYEMATAAAVMLSPQALSSFVGANWVLNCFHFSLWDVFILNVLRKINANFHYRRGGFRNNPKYGGTRISTGSFASRKTNSTICRHVHVEIVLTIQLCGWLVGHARCGRYTLKWGSRNVSSYKL